jgi:membrane associated rhomboid family serine protease
LLALSLGKGVPVLLGLGGVLVAVQLLNWVSHNALVVHGIFPRSLSGLQGVVLAPFIHGSFTHLFSNLPPLMVLGWLVSTEGVGRLVRVSIFITIVSGILVWLFARPAFHIGASGLIFGLWIYILARAWYQRSLASFLIALIAFIGYSSLILGFVPVPGISVESHLAGAIAGALAAKLIHSKRQI